MQCAGDVECDAEDRRLAAGLAIQLPLDHVRALRVLRLTSEIYNQFLRGDGSLSEVAPVGNVVLLAR